MNCLRPTLDTFETRDNPSQVFVGPHGGMATVDFQVQGTTIDESLVITGPNGTTLLNESAHLTYNPRTGAISGTETFTGPAGNSIVGTVTGTYKNGTLTKDVDFVGPNGQSVQMHGVYVVGNSSIQGNVVWTGPNGNTLERSGSATFDSTQGTLHLVGQFTGPKGNVRSYDVTLHQVNTIPVESISV